MHVVKLRVTSTVQKHAVSAACLIGASECDGE